MHGAGWSRRHRRKGSTAVDPAFSSAATGVPPGKAPVRLNTPGPGTVFQENFETVTAAPPYDLPAGWTISPTPGLPEDKWIAATLYGEKGVIAGKYAVILPSPDNTTPHDSWMFLSLIHI